MVVNSCGPISPQQMWLCVKEAKMRQSSCLAVKMVLWWDGCSVFAAPFEQAHVPTYWFYKGSIIRRWGVVLKMKWKWFENGMGVVLEWGGSGLVWEWSWSEMGMTWEWGGNVLGWDGSGIGMRWGWDEATGDLLHCVTGFVLCNVYFCNGAGGQLWPDLVLHCTDVDRVD